MVRKLLSCLFFPRTEFYEELAQATRIHERHRQRNRLDTEKKFTFCRGGAAMNALKRLMEKNMGHGRDSCR